jgi:hypothetical protein
MLRIELTNGQVISDDSLKYTSIHHFEMFGENTNVELKVSQYIL